MKNNRFQRDISHLISDICSEQEVLSYLEDVEENFHSEWLKEKGRHKLQLLWERRDSLSTNELFAIGKAISRLKAKHGVWLKKTIKDIKNQPKGAHGYITELLVASSITSENSLTIPASSNKPGFDVSLEGKAKNGKRILISVKNHDVSMHYENFTRYSEMIREEFKFLISNLKISARLVIYLSRPISKEVHRECMQMLHSKVKQVGEYHSNDGTINMIVSSLDDFNSRPVMSGSELCIIISPYHRNEHLGFIRKLEAASVNMNKHLPNDDNTVRMLYMRIHHAANAKTLNQIANNMLITDENCGFDQVMLVQPSVTRLPDGRSSIHTYVQLSEIKQPTPARNNIEVYKDLGRINFDLPIGSFSMSPSEIQLMDGSQEKVKLDECYIYQRGDIKVMAEKLEDGSYWGEASSPASGIHVIPMFEMDGHVMGLQAINPQYEELLLI
ncbi:hypothetical protein ACOI68_13095 [Klebsiella sp. C282]|uniref:hypothetical protein n=1 Tax=Klebsiella sp. C282 TaxID=3409936 RepID=UPI001645488D|nr:hypothetical protein [Klebsiella pneumoniae]